ncbi:MAG: phosphate ABC transporter permease PstA [Thermoleophilia bacterium]|nr:phosphate ABC transporter permease PstA [Thermoleophilia bacterium]
MARSDGAAGVATPPGVATPLRSRLRRPFGSRLADTVYLTLAGASAAAAIALVAYLIFSTARETSPVWETFGVWGFLTGREWVISPPTGGPRLGALPFIYGTLATSAIAMAIALPLSVGIALATTVFLPRPLRRAVAGVIDVLAAVPSVVFGFWAVVVLVPWANPGLEWIAEHNLRFLAFLTAVLLLTTLLSVGPLLRPLLALTVAGLVLVMFLILTGALHAPVGLLEGPVLSGSYMLAGIVLAVMILPITTAIIREVFATVPTDQQEAALALGATRWEMVQHSMIPWSRSGIVGASALGLGRAMGETIALALVLGSVPNVFGSLLGPGATAAGVIALQTGEAGQLQLAALTALAIVLFVMTMIINGLARILVRRNAGTSRRRRSAAPTDPDAEAAARTDGAAERAPAPALVREGAGSLAPVAGIRRLRSGVSETLIAAAVLIGMLPLAVLLVEVVRNGTRVLGASFFTEVQPTDPNAVAGFGIGNALVGTAILTGVAVAIAAPLGILTSLCINELNGMGGWPRRVGDAIGYFVDVMLGMPSIVAGLAAYLAIVIRAQQFSAFAGGLALAIVMFPIVVRAADEVLRLVPGQQREAALALGAPRWRTAWSVMLPAALPGIITGTMLALARAAGETAPLLFTSLGNQFYSTDLFEPIAALPLLIFKFTIDVRTDQSVDFAWGATLVLIAFILLLNLMARLTARLIQGGRRG